MIIERILTIDEGCFDNEVINIQNKKYFVKKLEDSNLQSPFFGGLLKKLSKIERIIFKKFYQEINPYAHRVVPKDRINYFEKELKTWKLWKKEGIPCLNVGKIEKGKIIWNFLEDYLSLKKSLNDKSSLLKFKNFLDLYSTIRDISKWKQDSDYLHSDPHLSNFLISENRKVVPIDSGCILDKNLGFENLDFYLLFQTMDSIGSLDTSDETKKQYIKMFKERLTKKEIDHFLDCEYKCSKVAKIYFQLREEIVSKIRSREKRNPFLSIETFNTNYNNYIKEIFSS